MLFRSNHFAKIRKLESDPMTLNLEKHASIGMDDNTTVHCGNEDIGAVVLNSGEGCSHPEYNELYWLQKTKIFYYIRLIITAAHVYLLFPSFHSQTEFPVI